jgi:hypothetical protein
VYFHLVEKVDIVFLAGRGSRNWTIWFSGVQLKYNTGDEGKGQWKVLSRSLSVSWMQML